MIYTLRFFSLQNAVGFIILTYLVSVLFTFYIQGVLKLRKWFRRQKVNGDTALLSTSAKSRFFSLLFRLEIFPLQCTLTTAQQSRSLCLHRMQFPVSCCKLCVWIIIVNPGSYFILNEQKNQSTLPVFGHIYPQIICNHFQFWNISICTPSTSGTGTVNTIQ